MNRTFKAHRMVGTGLTLVYREKGGVTAQTAGMELAERVAVALNIHYDAPKAEGPYVVLDDIAVFDSRFEYLDPEFALVAARSKAMAARIANALNAQEAEGRGS